MNILFVMKKILIISIISFICLGVFVFAASAKDLSDVKYPVAELGNCVDKEACADFCDEAENMEKCVNFAESNELLEEKEIKMARKMLEAGEKGGPGGCKGKTECEAYCDNMDNLEECMGFAEQNGLMEKSEIEEGKKVLQAMKKGIKPPKCGSKKSCDKYCASSEHMEECIVFGEAAGMIPENELEGAKKMLNAIKKGVKPLPCNGKNECDAHCEDHFEECINFSEAAGFMSAEEVKMARKTGGKGPGGCKGDACKTFCDNPDNRKVCLEFSLENDLMPPEEAVRAKKMLERGRFTGPGGCNGDECRTYCENPLYLEECIKYSVEMGDITPEQGEENLRNAKEGRKENMENGNIEQSGPGGCKGPEECDAYCASSKEHMEECANFFSAQQGQMLPMENLDMRMPEMENMQGNPENGEMNRNREEFRQQMPDMQDRENMKNQHRENYPMPQSEYPKQGFNQGSEQMEQMPRQMPDERFNEMQPSPQPFIEQQQFPISDQSFIPEQPSILEQFHVLNPEANSASEPLLTPIAPAPVIEAPIPVEVPQPVESSAPAPQSFLNQASKNIFADLVKFFSL